MSSSATFDSTILQVPQGSVRQQAKNERLKKSKFSKSSGSLSKSVVCSSCDEGDVSEEDGDRRRQSTGSDQSSTNVIFFKDITDSSAVSMDDQRRSLLRPGKRKSICSKIGLSKKAKVLRGPEGMEDSLVNFCETHRQLRLKAAERPPGRRVRPPTPDMQRKYNRPSTPKSEQGRGVRSPRPSTTGGIADAQKKYSDSIFGVFVKPETHMVKKRLVPAEKHESRNHRFLSSWPCRTPSKYNMEHMQVWKKKSPLSLLRPKEASTSKSHDETNMEFGADGQMEHKERCSVSTTRKMEISVQRSKSTLKSPNALKPVASKRSVHWEDQVQNPKQKNSSDDEKSTASTIPKKKTWQMECAKRASRIRRNYDKLRQNAQTKYNSANTPLEARNSSSKEDIQMVFTTEKTSFKLKRNTPSNNNIQQIETEIVKSMETKAKITKSLILADQNEEILNAQKEKTPNNSHSEKGKTYSSSEFEINRKLSRNSYSETSDDNSSNPERRNTDNEGWEGKHMYKESDADTSGLSGDESSTRRRCRRRRNRLKEKGRIIARRTSSPAICKSADSKTVLARRKSSPGVDRKLKIEQSESTLSSKSHRSEASVKEIDCLSKSHATVDSPHHKQMLLREFSKDNDFKVVGSHTNINRRSKSLSSTQPWIETTPKQRTDKDALFRFQECLKETEQCLEKLKTQLLPGTNDKSEIFHEIREKLSKIRNRVGIDNSELGKKSNSALNVPAETPTADPKPESRIEKKIKAVKNRANLLAATSKTKVQKQKDKPDIGERRGSSNILNKVIPQSERSKQILESWGSTEKSIGERSQRLLRTIRSMREAKRSLQDSTDIGKDRIDSECGNSLLKHPSKKYSEEKTITTLYKQETQQEVSINYDSDNLTERKEESNGNVYIASESMNSSNTPLEVVVGSENTGENIKTDDYSKESDTSKMKLTNTTQSIESVEHSVLKETSIDSQEKDDSDKVEENVDSENSCNKFVLVNPPVCDSVLDESNDIKRNNDSDSSTPSLGHVTTASIESLETEGNEEERAERTIPARRSSRPSSRYRDSSVPRSRVSSAGTSGRSSRRDQLPERPPSRKPYFTRNSEEEGDSDSNSPTRVMSSPQNSISPSSAANKNTCEGAEAKKPPPSRMYSTLKETPFNTKQSIKSAIEDLSLTTKSSIERTNLSVPTSTMSSPVTSQHKMPRGGVKEQKRPSTAVNDSKTSSTTVRSRVSPESLQRLKQKAKLNRETNDKNRPSTAHVNLSRPNSQESTPSSRPIDRQAYLKKRIATLSRPTTPLLQNNLQKNKSMSPSNAEKTNSQAISKNAVQTSVLKSSKFDHGTKDKGQHKVTFENVPTKEESIQKTQSCKRSLVSRRLTNYKPPWERVDLRTPESALAERARHEKKLFGEQGKPKSRPSSVSSRPQTPKVKMPDVKTKDLNTPENLHKEPKSKPCDGRDRTLKTPESRGKILKTPELRGKESKTIPVTRGRESKPFKTKDKGPNVTDSKINDTVNSLEEKKKESIKRRGSTPNTVRDKTRDDLRQELESDYMEIASLPNSSSYDTANSSGLQRPDFSDSSLRLVEAQEGHDGTRISRSTEGSIGNKLVRKSSSISSDGKTYRTNSSQTLDTDKESPAEPKKSKLKINVSVKTALTGTNVLCQL